MKRIVIIGANSFLAQNFYTYLTNVHQSIEIYLYDIQEFFSLNKSIYYQQIDFFSIPSIEKINFDVDYIYFFIFYCLFCKYFKSAITIYLFF